MANTFTNQDFELSIMDVCLSSSLVGPYLSLEASVPIPRSNHRNNSMCDSGVSLGEGSLDSLLGDVLQSGFEDDRHRCANCDETVVTARCLDCCDVICEGCVYAHRRSRFTKGHTVVRLTGEEEEEPEEPEVAGEASRLLAETRSQVAAVQKSFDTTQEVAKMTELNTSLAAQAISDTTRLFIKATMEREHELLSFLDRVRASKMSTLRRQGEELCVSMSKLNHLSEVLTSALERGSGLALWQAHALATSELALIRANREGPHEDSAISFVPPEADLLQAVRTMGRVASTGCAANSVVEGNSKVVVQGQPVSFNMLARDHLGEPCGAGYEAVAAVLAAPDGSLACAHVENHGDGSYLLTSYPQHAGQNVMHVTIRGLPVSGSPFPLSVQKSRDYRTVALPTVTFAMEGEEAGQLCRPWGICCDRDGNFIVADRSNNRIQVFHPDGSFNFQFGYRGSGPGQMDRPSGVTVNHRGHIVVADKDNHRIQVFSGAGEFLFTFGHKGCKPGQFNYPWDVAVNAAGHIVVSDTRNHRIQLFSAEGKFLNKYGFEGLNNMWKHFDSPRGVCFNADGQVMVTDFNNHRLVIIDANLCNARFLGCEGKGEKQFNRPQGVAVDDEGHILVADARNSRVQVFEQNGSFLHQFGSYGKGPGELDRPSGICLTPDGKIAVVDFGNNRILVF